MSKIANRRLKNMSREELIELIRDLTAENRKLMDEVPDREEDPDSDTFDLSDIFAFPTAVQAQAPAAEAHQLVYMPEPPVQAAESDAPEQAAETETFEAEALEEPGETAEAAESDEAGTVTYETALIQVMQALKSSIDALRISFDQLNDDTSSSTRRRKASHGEAAL